MVYIYGIFQIFGGRFTGKTSPLQLFWHTFDIAMTRFSGKKVLANADMDPVSRAAYSHEVISFGFWPGDENLPEPAFYSYTFPEPTTLTTQPLLPSQASWLTLPSGSLALAIFKYHDWLQQQDLPTTLLDFLEVRIKLVCNRLAGL